MRIALGLRAAYRTPWRVSYARLEWVKITHVPRGHRFAGKNMRGSGIARGVDEPERARAFERARGAQHEMIGARRTDDLQPDRQAVG